MLDDGAELPPHESLTDCRVEASLCQSLDGEVLGIDHDVRGSRPGPAPWMSSSVRRASASDHGASPIPCASGPTAMTEPSGTSRASSAWMSAMREATALVRGSAAKAINSALSA
ncbi:hypothetical protein AHiyo8_21430 [Arthrobacter sp. Hiyo8]|nr:hypothetical protein AHiyo8_21430 [Arthrobacter sp. Hiyo8]